MKNNWLLSLSAVLYIMYGVLFLMALLFGYSSPDDTHIGVAVFLSAFCFYLAYAALRARTGTFNQKRNFAVAAGIFCGGVASLSGLDAGLFLGIPLAVGILGMREILWR